MIWSWSNTSEWRSSPFLWHIAQTSCSLGVVETPVCFATRFAWARPFPADFVQSLHSGRFKRNPCLSKGWLPEVLFPNSARHFSAPHFVHLRVCVRACSSSSSLFLNAGIKYVEVGVGVGRASIVIVIGSSVFILLRVGRHMMVMLKCK